MDQLLARYQKISQALFRIEGQRDALRAQQTSLESLLESLRQETDEVTNVKLLLEAFVKSTEKEIRDYIEPVVTEALEFIFAQGLKFHLLFVTRRNQIEIDFIILRSEESEADYQMYIQNIAKYGKQLESLVKETKNINFMYGGAVNQVLGLILRLVLVELFRVKGPVLLDEPTSAVGEDYSARVGQLLSSLSKRFNRQYVLITHSKTLASFADRIYSVEKVNGSSQVCIEENG